MMGENIHRVMQNFLLFMSSQVPKSIMYDYSKSNTSFSEEQGQNHLTDWEKLK